jgi:hypothetical protein
MLETFGASYRAYMARTGRVFPSILRNSFAETDLKGQRYPRRSGTKHLKFRAFSATSSQKRLSGLLVRPSLHCPRSERQVSSSRISELRTYAAGNLDVEIRDPRCRFSGFRGNSRCCRPPTAPAGRLHCSSRQISHRQEPRRQIPCREGACGDHQGLISRSIRAHRSFRSVAFAWGSRINCDIES